MSSNCPALRALLGAQTAHAVHIAACARCRALVQRGLEMTIRARGCADVEALIAARLVEDLGADSDAALAQHLEHCDACLEIAVDVERGALDDTLVDLDSGLDNFPELCVVDPSNYVLGGEVGRGGMGRIIRARDRRLGRLVVLKELLDERQRARFEHEARLTARLQHPAIVSVHEAGRWPNGEPFYAMKFVVGESLDKVIARKTAFDDRLALLPSLITVVEAVAYAHSEKIIHRDLKPANILIGAFGETVVIDWGLARELSEPDVAAVAAGPYRGDERGITHCGGGTPQYMPPEQIGEHVPDERLDVYALGATLYHLLAGQRPYGSLSPKEVLQRTVSGGPEPLGELEPRTPRALRAIVAKAMAHRPAARYRNAGDLAADLHRFQGGQLVAAHHYSMNERAARFLRRNRSMVLVGGVLVAALSGIGVLGVKNVLDGKRRSELQLGAVLLERGERYLTEGEPSRSLVYLAEALRRGLDTPKLRALAGDAGRQAGAQAASFSIGGLPTLARFSRDGKRLATAGLEGVRLFDVGEQRLLASAIGEPVTALAFRADGKRLLTARPCDIETIADCEPIANLWDATDGRLIAVLTASSRLTDPGLTGVGFDGEGHPGLAGGGHITLFDDSDGQIVAVVASQNAAIAIEEGVDIGLLAEPHGSIKLSAGSSTVELGQSGEQMVDHGAPIAAVRMTEDGGMVATIGVNGVVRIWNAATGALAVSLDGQTGPLLDAAFSDGGRRFNTVTADGVVRSWRTDTRLLRSAGDGKAVRAARFDDQSRIVLTRKDGAIELSDGGPFSGVAVRGGQLGGDHRFVSAHLGHVLFDVNGGAMLADWDPATGGVELIEATTSTGPLLGVAPDHGLVLYASGALAHPGSPPFVTLPATHLALSDDGRRVVGLRLGMGAGVGIWDAATGRLLHTLPVQTPAAGLYLSPQDRRLAVVADDGVQVWDVDEEKLLGTVATDQAMAEILWAPDAETLLLVGDDAYLHSARGQLLATIRAPGGSLTAAAFSPDGERILTGSTSGRAQLWDTATGDFIAGLGPLRDPISALAFSPDGRSAFVAAESSRTLWDVSVERRPSDAILALASTLPFAFDGVQVVPTARTATTLREPATVRRAREHARAGTEYARAGSYGSAAHEFEAAYAQRMWPGYLAYECLSYAAIHDEDAVAPTLLRLHLMRAPAATEPPLLARTGGRANLCHFTEEDGEPVTLMRSHFDKGQILYSEGRYEAAACEFLAAYRAKPSAPLLYDAAVGYEKDQRYDQAISLYTEYLQKQPDARDRSETERRIVVLRQQLGTPR